MLKIVFSAAMMLSLLFFSVGCQSAKEESNNHLRIEDLCSHLIADGIPITQVQAIKPELYKAVNAWAFQINGRDDQEIGVYKFDITNAKMAEYVADYKRKGYVMTLGLKFPAVFSGSFMLIGVEKNDYREQIVESLKTFN